MPETQRSPPPPSPENLLNYTSRRKNERLPRRGNDSNINNLHSSASPSPPLHLSRTYTRTFFLPLSYTYNCSTRASARFNAQKYIPGQLLRLFMSSAVFAAEQSSKQARYAKKKKKEEEEERGIKANISKVKRLAAAEGF